MIVFWGEPGAHEPLNTTPLMFLGVDGRWRSLTASDLGVQLSTDYLQNRGGALSPDGSRWVTHARGWNQLVDFKTGKMRRLLTSRFAWSSQWSSNSKYLVLSDIAKTGIHLFDRSGKRLATLSVTPRKKTVQITDDGEVVVFDRITKQTGPRLSYTIYDHDANAIDEHRCLLPDGFPTGTGVDLFDGRRLWITALVDKQKSIYRHALIDLTTRTVLHNVDWGGSEFIWFPGPAGTSTYLSSVNGGARGIFGIDAEAGIATRLTRITPYERQEGYENHANSEFARDLIFDDATNLR